MKRKENVKDIESSSIKETNKLKINWVNRFPDNMNEKSFDEFRFNYSNLCIWFVVRHTEKLHFLLDKVAKLDVPSMHKGIIKTPDMQIFHNNKTIIYEFTSFMYEPETEVFNDIIQEKQEKYDGDEIRVIGILADDMFPKRMKLGVKESRLFYTCRTQLLDYWTSKGPSDEITKNYRNPKSGVTSLMRSSEFNPWTNEEMTKKFEEDPKSWEDYLTDIIKHLPRFKKFLEANLLRKENFIETISRFPKTPCNVSKDHPFRRTLNNKWRNNGNMNPHGHRAANIFDFIIDRSQKYYVGENFVGKKSYSKMFLSLMEKFEVLRPEIEVLDSMNRDKAILRNTSTNDDVLKKLCDKYYFKTNKPDDLYEFLGSLQHSIVANIKKPVGEDFILQNRGTIKLVNETSKNKYKLGSETHNINPEKGGTLKNEFSKEKDEETYCERDNEIGNEIFKLLSNFTFPNLNIPTFKNAYTNKDCQNIVNTLSKNSSGFWKDINTDPFFQHILNTADIYRDILMSVPKSDTKYADSAEFKQVYSELGVKIFVSMHPNNITSGLIFLSTTFDKDQYLLKSKSRIFPKHEIIFENESKVTILFKPFRQNLSQIMKFDNIVGSYLGFQLEWYSRNFKILDNNLVRMMFLNYKRQFTLLTDYMFLIYKSAFSTVGFGKIDGKEKFKKMIYKDIRVSTMYQNCRINYSKFIKEMANFRETGQKFTTVHCPFTGQKMKSLKDYQQMMSLKHAYLKDDGFDQAFYAWTFYLGDMEQENEWSTNPFNTRVNKEAWYMTLDDFFKNLYKEDGKWNKITYHGGIIFKGIKSMYEKYSERIDGDFISRTNTIMPTDNIRNSKVNVPMSFSTTEKLKGKYPGLRTMSLSESIYYDISLFMEFGKYWEDDINSRMLGKHTSRYKNRQDEETYMMTTIKRIKINSSSKLTNSNLLLLNTWTDVITKPSIKNEKWDKESVKISNLVPIVIDNKNEPTLLELALFDAWKYPQIVFLTTHNKDQIGYDKRQFFIQSINGRNQNSIIDEGYFPLLSTNPYDMIVKRGDEKLIDIGKMIENCVKRSKVGVILSSEDQTKFGDTYPLESFEILDHALASLGYFSESVRRFISHCNKGMHGRKILTPHKAVEELAKYQKGEKSIWAEKVLVDGILNQITFKESVLFKNDASIFDDLNTGEFTEALLNPGFRKYCGFALGVSNKKSTVLSCLHQSICDDIMKKFDPNFVFEARSHSDDSIKCIGAINIDDDYFMNTDISELCNLIANKWSAELDPITKQLVLKKDGVRKVFDYRILTIVLMCISILAPRFVGQRPSLLKWFFGKVGEVLQTIVLSNGLSVPTTKFPMAIMKDLPGKSYSTDLIGMISRVNEILAHGDNMLCCHMLIQLSNWLCIKRYGGNIEEYSERRIPVIKGLWYSLPFLVVDQGFDANLIRLLAEAELPQNLNLKRMLQICLMTPDMWILTAKTETTDIIENREKLIKEGMALENNDLGLATVKDEFERLGDNFIDFYIRSRFSFFTLSSFLDQIKRYKNIISTLMENKSITMTTKQSKIAIKLDIDATLSENFKDFDLEPTKFIKEFIVRNKPIFLYNLPLVEHKIVRFLNKYTTSSFQDSYLRVSESARALNRLGYLNRIMKIPFSQDILKYVNPKLLPVRESHFVKKINKETKVRGATINFESDPIEESQVCTINQILESVIDLSDNLDFNIPEANKTIYNLFERLYSKKIIQTNSLKIKFLSYVEEEGISQDELILLMDYRMIRRDKIEGATNKYARDIVGLLIETLSWKKTVNTSILMKTKPYIFMNELFTNSFNDIYKTLKMLDLKPGVLEQGSETLIRLLTLDPSPMIIKTGDANNIVLDLMENRGADYSRSKYFVSDIVNSVVQQKRNYTGNFMSDYKNILVDLYILMIGKKITKDVNYKIESSGNMGFKNTQTIFSDFIKKDRILTASDLSSMLAGIALTDNEINKSLMLFEYNKKCEYKNVKHDFHKIGVFTTQGRVLICFSDNYKIMVLHNALDWGTVRSILRMMKKFYLTDLKELSFPKSVKSWRSGDYAYFKQYDSFMTAGSEKRYAIFNVGIVELYDLIESYEKLLKPFLFSEGDMFIQYKMDVQIPFILKAKQPFGLFPWDVSILPSKFKITFEEDYENEFWGTKKYSNNNNNNSYKIEFEDRIVEFPDSAYRYKDEVEESLNDYIQDYFYMKPKDFYEFGIHILSILSRGKDISGVSKQYITKTIKYLCELEGINLETIKSKVVDKVDENNNNNDTDYREPENENQNLTDIEMRLRSKDVDSETNSTVNEGSSDSNKEEFVTIEVKTTDGKVYLKRKIKEEYEVVDLNYPEASEKLLSRLEKHSLRIDSQCILLIFNCMFCLNYFVGFEKFKTILNTTTKNVIGVSEEGEITEEELTLLVQLLTGTGDWNKHESSFKFNLQPTSELQRFIGLNVNGKFTKGKEAMYLDNFSTKPMSFKQTWLLSEKIFDHNGKEIEGNLSSHMRMRIFTTCFWDSEFAESLINIGLIFDKHIFNKILMLRELGLFSNMNIESFFFLV